MDRPQLSLPVKNANVWKQFCFNSRTVEQMIASADRRGWRILPDGLTLITKAFTQISIGPHRVALISVSERSYRAKDSQTVGSVLQKAQELKYSRPPTLLALLYAADNDPAELGDKDLCFMHKPVYIRKQEKPDVKRGCVCALAFKQGHGTIGVARAEPNRKITGNVDFAFCL